MCNHTGEKKTFVDKISSLRQFVPCIDTYHIVNAFLEFRGVELFLESENSQLALALWIINSKVRTVKVYKW
jgi:hypothetical protein